MAAKRFKLIEVIADENQATLNPTQDFIMNFQEAMLLSLLEKNLLTQWQFDRCMEEVKKTKEFKINPCL